MIRRIMQIEIATNEDPGFEDYEEGDCVVFIRDPRTKQVVASFAGYTAEWVPE